jgi:hypothetical protein
MYLDLIKNSYVAAIVAFVIAWVMLYLIDIGTDIKISNGKKTKVMGWKYPLAIALIVWLIWYFFLFPQKESNIISNSNLIPELMTSRTPNGSIRQQIMMDPWM